MLKVILGENATLPTKGSPESAGFDLYSAEKTVVTAKGKALVKTNIQISIPEGCYGRIAPRSGLSWKNHIDVGAGVIDRDYRGLVGVVLFNHSDKDLEISTGDRIAQLIMEKYENVDVIECTELELTERGEGGFGSTGR